MDESGGFTSPAPSTFNYMSVPAKIELSSGGVRGAGGYSTNAEGQGHMDQTGYRPMKVPDMITLESTAATDGSTPRETDHSGISRRIAERVEPMSQVQPVEAPKWTSEPQQVVQDTSPAIADLDRRVRSLEQQVQRLKDVAVNKSGPGATKQGNNFWYVVTFAGWMMVPLIVAYMYRYKR